MNILLATDGSSGALAAAQLLAALPLDTDCRLTLVTVVSSAGEADGHAALATTCATLNHCPASLETHVVHGHPVEEILRATEAHRTDLLVVGASGHSALVRFFLGSVAERVARHASCPVLVARPLQAGLQELIVGVDGSPSASQAARWVQRFPLPSKCEIRLVTVLPRAEELTRTSRLLPLPLLGHRDAQAFIERLRQDAHDRLQNEAITLTRVGKRAITEIRSGDPASTLLQTAEDESAELLVVGAHGLSAVERFVMGSVSERVLRHARCSVLVVKQARKG
jgi:nucleotide-binding universal stress UspA family protein